ncbi:YkgJ family cysteine cluster protein [Methanolapillus millepedarum]
MKKIESDLAYFKDESDALLRYPKEDFIRIVREVGFECDLCGKCCTKAFNDHVFLLDSDVKRILEIEDAGESVLIPSPYFDFCDQYGNFYVSGFCLKTKNDEIGTCSFLENGRCRIYDKRPLICRVYPYMLHREFDENGTYDWRQISGLNEHGFYETELDTEDASDLYDLTFQYEKEYIEQEQRFLKALSDHFEKNNLKFAQRIYDLKTREYEKGNEATVFVYFDGTFAERKAKMMNRDS